MSHTGTEASVMLREQSMRSKCVVLSIERGKKEEGDSDSLSKNTQMGHISEIKRCREPSDTRNAVFHPERGTWARQLPYQNMSCIHESWLVFHPPTHTPFITPVLPSTSFIPHLSHHLFLSLCWLSILQSPASFYPTGSQSASVKACNVKASGCHNSLTHHCQTLIWSQVTGCIVQGKEWIWTGGDVSLSRLGWMILGGGLWSGSWLVLSSAPHKNAFSCIYISI